MNFIEKNNELRLKNIALRGKSIPLPIYFPSVSSLKTNLSPYNYVEFLQTVKYSQYLVSAFDIAHFESTTDFYRLIKENLKKDGSLVLMDSGNYESYWTRNTQWTKARYYDVLKENICDLAFTFDNQQPPSDYRKNVEWVVRSVEEARSLDIRAAIVPIVHCKRDELNQTILALCESANLLMVAIPERILGNGILERVNTVVELRKCMNRNSSGYTLMHILGTGNPLSLLLFSLAGADSFDGLEWCQTVVNRAQNILLHFQHRDLVKDDCAFCREDSLGYAASTLGHNLLYYQQWMKEVQDVINSENHTLVLTNYFSNSVINKLKEIFK